MMGCARREFSTDSYECKFERQTQTEVNFSKAPNCAAGVWESPTLQCIFLSKRLLETHGCGQRQPGGGIHATSWRAIWSAEYIMRFEPSVPKMSFLSSL